jgi:hypothetical protein
MAEKVVSLGILILSFFQPLLLVVVLVAGSSLVVQPVWAQTPSPTSRRLTILEERLEKATASGLPASPMMQEATPAAATKKVEKEPDLTEPKPEVKGKLEQYLAQQPVGSLSVTNFLKYLIRQAVERGVAANTIVLVLMFPLVAAWVAFSRHVIGLAGFGIFTPAILGVVFLSTGIIAGVALFMIIILAATFARLVLKPVRLQYLPRMAFLLWFVSLAVFGLMSASAYLAVPNIAAASIFPILILILLAETFMEVQIKDGMRQASSKTLITMLVAALGYGLLQWEFLQRFALLEPELFVLAIGLFDIGLGKYTGLRWLEYYRFRQILNSSKKAKE